MNRQQLYLLAVVVAGVLSWILVNVNVMPTFTLLATPGVLLGLMAAGNTPDDNRGFIFFGNSCFYFLVFAVLTELILAFRRMRTR
jgi:hypothetical protein